MVTWWLTATRDSDGSEDWMPLNPLPGASGQRDGKMTEAGLNARTETPWVSPSFPSLEFRREVIVLIQQLSSLPHRRACVTLTVASAIRRIARIAKARQPNGGSFQKSDEFGVSPLDKCLPKDLAGVLVLGGVLDTLAVRDLQQDPEDFANVVAFDDAVFEAFFEMAAGLLAADRPSACAEAHKGEAAMQNTGLLLQVIQTRTLKALWDLVAVPRLRALMSSKYPDLIQILVGISETPVAAVPFTYFTPPPVPMASKSVNSASNLTFDVASVLSSRVYITNHGLTCDIRSGAECSVMVGQALHKGTGRHYCEFKIVSTRGDYSFIGCAVSSYRTSHVIGEHRGSWAWANDGDFKVGGDWCGDRGLAPFRSGDHVGVLVDMDKNTLRFTKNGKLLRKACSLGSACATGDGVRFAVGSNSQLKIEIADTYKYRFLRECGSDSDPTPWLTMEMIIAKSHFLSLEAHGGAAAQKSEVVIGREQLNTKERGEIQADDAGSHQDPCRAVYSAQHSEVQTRAAAVAVAQASERRRVCMAAASFFESGSAHRCELACEKDSFSFGEALVRRGMVEEVLFPDARAGPSQNKAASGVGGVAHTAVSPWQTSGDKRRLLLQCEGALMGHFARLCVLDLMRARHVPTAQRVDAARLISILIPFFPSGYAEPRAICSTAPYANMVAFLDQVIAGWISVRGDGDAQALAQQLRALATATSDTLQYVCHQHRLHSYGVHSLVEWACHRPSTIAPLPASVVTWMGPRKLILAAKSPPRDETEADRGGPSANLAAWLSRHLSQRYGLSGHVGCAEALGQLQERLIQAISVSSSPTLCLSLLQALQVAVTQVPADDRLQDCILSSAEAVAGTSAFWLPTNIWLRTRDSAVGSIQIHDSTDVTPNDGIFAQEASGRDLVCSAKTAWSPLTLQILRKLRSAALQQLVEQQQPGEAKLRVLHTQLLQALLGTVVAVDLRLCENIEDILLSHLSAAESLFSSAPLPSAPGIQNHQRSEKTQQIVDKLLQMGFTQRNIDIAMWVTANLNIEDLSSEAGTRMLNYLSCNYPMTPTSPFMPQAPGESIEGGLNLLGLTANAAANEGAPPAGANPPEDAGRGVSERDSGGGGVCRGQQTCPGVEWLWEKVGKDAGLCKALRTMESGLLLSHALRCLENEERLPLWLQVSLSLQAPAWGKLHCTPCSSPSCLSP
jgi:hypothetical protein